MNPLLTINIGKIATQLLNIFMRVESGSEEEDLLNILHSHMNSYS